MLFSMTTRTEYLHRSKSNLSISSLNIANIVYVTFCNQAKDKMSTRIQFRKRTLPRNLNLLPSPKWSIIPPSNFTNNLLLPISKYHML